MIFFISIYGTNSYMEIYYVKEHKDIGLISIKETIHMLQVVQLYLMVLVV